VSDTLFTRIIKREIPAQIIHEDDLCLAFNDINPQAPIHFLVIPRKPIPTLNDIAEADCALIGHLFRVAAAIARDKGFAEDGYRAVVNCNDHGGQTVNHLHVHVIGGKPLGWPPFTERRKSGA